MEQKHLSQDVFGSFLKLENLSTDQLGLGTLGVKKELFSNRVYRYYGSQTESCKPSRKLQARQELVYRLRKITIKMYR